MLIDRSNIKYLKTGLKIMAVWFAAVMLYFNVIIQTLIVRDEIEYALSEYYLVAALISLLLGILGAIIELYFQIKQFKKAPFFLVVSGKTILLFLAFILTVYFIFIIGPNHRMEVSGFFDRTNFFLKTIVHREFINHLFYTLLLGFVINLCVQINKKIGPGVLLSLILGRYHKPRKEERIFAFLDLISSSLIAEQLKPELYSSFIKDFFYDVDVAIEKTKGTIFQYVGDEVVIIWKKADGIKYNNCVNLYFEAEKQIQKNRNFYLKKYSVIPDFKIGIHIGEIIITEVGGVKKEIAYHGDVINTTSRIRSVCTELNERVLISADLLSHLIDIDKDFFVESKGVTNLKGKENIIGIFSIKPFATKSLVN